MLSLTRSRGLLVLIAASIVWSACIPNPDIDDTSPSDGATDVALNTAVTIYFNREIEGNLFNQYDFTLTNELTQESVAGEVSRKGNKDRTEAVFTPSTLLAENTPYRGAWKHKSGGGEIQDYEWTFSTRSRAWGESQGFLPTPISLMANYTIAMDTNGNLNVISAQEKVGGSVVIRFHQYDSQAGTWDSDFGQTLVESTSTKLTINDHRLEEGPNGVLYLLWTETEELGLDTQQQMRVNRVQRIRRYVPSEKRWDEAETLFGLTNVIASGVSVKVKVVIEPNGNALFLMGQSSDLQHGRVYSRYFSATKGWSPQLIPVTSATEVFFPLHLAYDGTSKYVGLLQKWDPVTQQRSFWSSEYTKDAGMWTPVQQLVAPSDMNSYSNTVFKLDAQGKGNFFWNSKEDLGANDELKFMRRTYQAGSWQPIELLKTVTVPDGKFLSFEAASSVLVYAFQGASDFEIHAVSEKAGVWESEQLGNAYGVLPFRLSEDLNGNVLVMWPHYERLLAQRYQASLNAWLPTETVMSLASGFTPVPSKFSFSPLGDGTFIWLGFDLNLNAFSQPSLIYRR